LLYYGEERRKKINEKTFRDRGSGFVVVKLVDTKDLKAEGFTK